MFNPQYARLVAPACQADMARLDREPRSESGTAHAGMLTPTGGSAIVDGRDVERDMPQLRASLGVCPQYDMLWPLLTVREHLRIYAALRGIPKVDVPDAAFTAAAEVDLLDRMDVRSEELSGGQRRKLSVAIAFLGNPRVVVRSASGTP